MKFTVDLKNPDFVKSWVSGIRISHIVLFSAILRFFVMCFPQDGQIFDEVHYIGAVRALMQGVPANPEHPPLTKFIVMWSVQIFGDHWFAWRFPMVIFSLISTYLLYRVAKELLHDETKALMAAALMIFDIVFFIQGNIFVLEPPAMTFALGFVLLYLQKRYWASATAIGFGFLCNEKALFFLLGVALYHVSVNFTRPSNEIIKRVAVFLGICVLVGGGGLALSDWKYPPSKSTKINVSVASTIFQDEFGNPVRTETATHTQTTYDYVANPVDHVLWMMFYYSGINDNLVTAPENLRLPWTWVLPLGNWLNPPIYLSTVIKTPTGTYYPVNYRSQEPFFIWFMTVPVLLLCAWLWRRDNNAKFIASMIVGNFAFWFVLGVTKMSMPFNHYFLFTAPWVCLAIPWFWSVVAPRHWKAITAAQILLSAALFFVFFPVGLVRLI